MKPHLYFALAAAVLLSLVPHAVFAQSAAPVSGCGSFGTAFNNMSQAMNAAQSFFYGPFFKVGCLVAMAVSGVMLLLDEGQLGGVAKMIFRTIMLVAFVLGAASFLNIGATSC